ncbi:MAG: DUF1294 domain-containing protein [Candidatus Caldarchaeum sp.]
MPADNGEQGPAAKVSFLRDWDDLISLTPLVAVPILLILFVGFVYVAHLYAYTSYMGKELPKPAEKTDAASNVSVAITQYTVDIVRVLNLATIAFSSAVVSRIAFSRYVGSKAIQPSGQDVVDFTDYYSLLGVARNASTSEIRKAFRRFVKRYHPDVSGHPLAEEAMKAASQAIRVLTDPVKRRKYDETMALRSVKPAAGSVHSLEKTVRVHGRNLCRGFSAIPVAVIVLLLVNSVARLSSMFPQLLSPPAGGWLAVEAIISIPVLLLGFWIASRSAFILVVGGFMWIAIIPIALYVVFLPLSVVMTGQIPYGADLPVKLLAAVCYSTVKVLAASLRQIDVIYLFVVMNVLAAVAMLWDKRQARLSGWRISEAALQRMAIAGGGLAMLLVSLALGHKIRKTGFMLTVAAAFIINTVIIGMAVRV